MNELEVWKDLYKRLAKMNVRDKEVFLDLIKNVRKIHQGRLETVNKDKIDSVREYLKWLDALSCEIEHAGERYKEIVKNKSKVEKFSFNFDRLFKKGKDETDLDVLNDLRAGLIMEPH